ncbi:MAG: hypothetical protein IJW68_08625 [Bacteroidaceae bacterium]|nr:hypothetical protein [Bacteroidaceae bacterium]
MEILNILLLAGIYVEMAVLAYFEHKLWNTFYTPLNFLMVPYAVVLLFCVLVCGNFDVVDFYYPSLILWMFGLLLFAIPSYLFALSYQQNIQKSDATIIDDSLPMKIIDIMTFIIVALFMFRLLRMVQTSPHLPGSFDFGQEYCGKGIWGHLHRLFHALVILYIYKYDNKHWYYALLVVAMFIVSFMYGVNSWVIIPTMAGLAMRLYTGKMKLRLSLLLKIIFFGFSVFIVSYTIALFIGKGDDAASYDVIFDFICKIFIHYFISGIVGWSQDLQMGILERPDSYIILACLINLLKAFTGGGDFVEVINPHFIHNGIRGSNVRAFFGTIYVNTSIIEFVLLILFFSALMYMLKVWLMRTKSLFVALVYFFYMGMLTMGWFEYYFYHLPFLEVPAWIFILYLFFKKFGIGTADSSQKKEISPKNE